jgi:hypothetical protein
MHTAGASCEDASAAPPPAPPVPAASRTGPPVVSLELHASAKTAVTHPIPPRLIAISLDHLGESTKY